MDKKNPTIERALAALEKIASSFESIAASLAGIHGAAYKAATRFSPDSKPYREAVVSRIPTEEDKIKEAHGASDKPIEAWISEVVDSPEEYIGPREREFLEERRAETPKRDSENG